MYILKNKTQTMKHNLGDLVIWNKNGKQYKIVGDKNHPIEHQLFGKMIPEKENDYYIAENIETYSHPIAVPSADIKPNY